MNNKCKECGEIITSPKWFKAIFCSRTCFSINRIGKHIHNKKSLKKISDNSKKLWSNSEYKKKMSQAHIGQKAWNKGKKTPFKVIEKLRESHLGIRLSEETKKKMSIARKGKNLREKNGSWNGGSSFYPYSIAWTKALKETIRERDEYSCRICSIKNPGDRSFHVHHIDYDKQNCNPINLITLCHRCHMKTHHNRNHWKKYFADLILKVPGNDIVRPTTICKIVEINRNV